MWSGVRVITHKDTFPCGKSLRRCSIVYCSVQSEDGGLLMLQQWVDRVNIQLALPLGAVSVVNASFGLFVGPSEREAKGKGVWCPPPVWNLRVAIWFLSTLGFLPSSCFFCLVIFYWILLMVHSPDFFLKYLQLFFNHKCQNGQQYQHALASICFYNKGNVGGQTAPICCQPWIETESLSHFQKFHSGMVATEVWQSKGLGVLT